ncbi:iron complex outermembrane recepter protein [Sphingomonas gellani]|uniref:Iron complex outermembrane recepter protein n=1 Tax=Sphingomonas gellani TaxID=1166340 RepID=A0A1H8GUD6_9SPHN|nr:TonB-dependent receptor [Sphingomonas gellani]SEN46878.1 iron complex outermembrane recepter protein [Sphingomonas gellani]
MPLPISRLALAGAFLSPCVAAPLAAQTTPPSGSEDILVVGQHSRDTLTTPDTTGSRLGLTPLETPATLSVIDGDTIRARGDMSVIDAESRAPGISNAGNPGNGGTALTARGFSGQGSVLQLIDGIRLFPAAGTITFPTDPWMVTRIDVLNGPASVLYGQGALGGAVNVLMRKPNTQRTEVEGEIGYGSQNSFHVAAGAGGPLTERLSYRVDGSYRRSDGYVDRGDARSHALSGTLRWTPTDTLVVTARDDYGHQDPMRYFGTPLIDGRLDDDNRRRNYNTRDGFIRYRDNRTTVQADWTPRDTLTISNQAYRLTSRRSWLNLESYCWIAAEGVCLNGANSDAATPGRILRTDMTGIVHDQTQWGDQGSVTLRTPIGEGIGNDFVAGFDVNLVKLTYSHNFGSDPQVSEVDPFDFDPGSIVDTQGIAPRYRTRTNEYAFFAEDRLTLGTHLSIVGGVRHERDRARRWTIDYPEGDRRETFALDKRLHNTTWRVGSVYQPIPTVSLYAQYATGVDPIGTLTTYSTGQVQFSNARGDQVEAGAKAVFLDGHGTATIAAYRIVKKGLLAQLTPTSPVEQVGQRSAKGVEAAISLDLPHGIGIGANGSVLDARFDDFLSGGTSFNGNTPPDVPEMLANLWLRWDATRLLQARAGLRYVGRRYSDNANRFRVPAYATVDATLSYALTPRLALDVHAYNLFDRNYALNTYGNQQWVLGRPRSIDVSLRVGF